MSARATWTPLTVIATAFVAAAAATGCGSASPPTGVPTAAGSTPVSTGAGTSPATGNANSGGVADTPANPDRTYVCAAVTPQSGQAIAYLTVAGSDTAAAQSECSTLEQGSDWASVASSPYDERLYTPVCFITFDSGQVTARLYTSDTATFAQGVALCNPILHGFNLATLPPS